MGTAQKAPTVQSRNQDKDSEERWPSISDAALTPEAESLIWRANQPLKSFTMSLIHYRVMSQCYSPVIGRRKESFVETRPLGCCDWLSAPGNSVARAEKEPSLSLICRLMGILFSQLRFHGRGTLRGSRNHPEPP